MDTHAFVTTSTFLFPRHKANMAKKKRGGGGVPRGLKKTRMMSGKSTSAVIQGGTLSDEMVDDFIEHVA